MELFIDKAFFQRRKQIFESLKQKVKQRKLSNFNKFRRAEHKYQHDRIDIFGFTSAFISETKKKMNVQNLHRRAIL